MLTRKNKRKIVSDLFPPTASLFSKMDYNFQIITKDKLDLIFLLSEGQRYVNSIVEYYVHDDEISSSNMTALAELTLAFYKERWDKLVEIYSIEYDPIHNFSDDLHEVIDDGENTSKDNTGTQTNTGTQGKSGTINNTGTQANAGSMSSTDNSLIYGLNSATGVGADDLLKQSQDSNTRTDNLTETQNMTRTDNLMRTDNLSEEIERTYDRDRTQTRIGNIGNITTQKMLMEEIELWKWNFVWEVIADVKDFLCLRLYRNEVV